MLLFKFMLSYAYFAVSQVCVLYLSQEHDYDDQSSALMYGVFGFSISLSGMITGPLIDRMGVRRSLVLGALLACVGMFAFALAFTRSVLIVALLIGMPIGLSFGLPVIDIGCKRYTFAGDRKLAFALTYSAMNVGAAVAGLTFDALRRALDAPHGGRWRVSDGYEASAERLLVLSAACATAVAGLLAALLVRDVQRTRDGGISVRQGTIVTHVELSERGDTALVDDNDGVVFTINEEGDDFNVRHRRNRCKSAYSELVLYMRSTMCTRIFWRLVLFTSVMLPVRQVFRQLDATLPKWALRVLGPGAPIGSLYAINPSTIVFMAPLAAVLFERFDLYTVITCGSAISALGILVLGAQPSVGLVSLALLVFTVGEAIYSPQVVTFVMALSPDNREGAYTSLANAPTFLSKILVGAMSGSLLVRFCPHTLDSYDRAEIRNFADNTPPPRPMSTTTTTTTTTFANVTSSIVNATATLVSNFTTAASNSTQTTANNATMGIVTHPITVTQLPKPRHDAERDCAKVWFIIGGVALLTPLLLVVVRRWVYTDQVKMTLARRTEIIKFDGNEED